MQCRSSALIASSGLSDEVWIAGGICGSAMILASALVGQTAGWWAVLELSLFLLWQFDAPRVFRGPAGELELLRVRT